MLKHISLIILIIAALNSQAQVDNASLSSLPEITLKNIDGKDINLADYGTNEKITVISFWATWCNPCKAEMPTLEAIHKRMDNDKFTVIGIHVGPGPENIRNYLKISPVTFPIYIDMDLEYDWGVPGLPTTFLISPDGEMLYRAVGKRDFSSPQMEEFFNQQVNNYFK